jgi:hypothetical protein
LTEQERIVRYWHAIELLQPQSAPKLRKRHSRYDAFFHDTPIRAPVLPWMPDSLVATQPLPKKRVWRHTLFAHIYNSRLVADKLAERFGSDQGYQEPQSRDSALFAVKFSQAGHLLPDSVVLSSEAWVLGKIIHNQDWTRGFEEDQQAANLHALSALQGPVSAYDLHTFTDWILDFIGLGDFFGDANQHQYRFRSQPVHPNKIVAEEDPLNSFLLTDLADVAEHINRGEISRPLAQYLSHHDPSLRRHIDNDQESLALIERLYPEHYAAGCWPAARHLGLVHSQQLAVNTILSDLAQGQGIMGINGPPGTGKTTLLRDLIAAIITGRADELAKLRRASDGFAQNAREVANEDGKQQWCFKLNPALLGFEIVIASSNNGAVENVTLELPQQDKIDESWLPDAAYFPELGELLTQTPAWGLISGALGSKARRTRFVEAYFNGQSPYPRRATNETDKDDTDSDVTEDALDDDEELNNLVDTLFVDPHSVPNSTDSQDEEADSAENETVPRGFLGWLNEQADINATRTPAERHAIWQRAVEDYQAIKEESNQIRERVSKIRELVSLVHASRSRPTPEATRLQQLAHDADLLRQQRSALDESEIHPAHAALKKSLDALIQHHAKKPTLWTNIRSLWQAQRGWSSLQILLESQRDLAQSEVERLGRITAQLDAKQATVQTQLAQEEHAQQQRQERDQAVLNEAVSLATSVNAIHLLAWLQGHAIGRGHEVELAEPWNIAGWRQARARVFIQALKLHKTFFELEAARTRSNLSLINSHLTGTQFKGFSRDAIRSAWASLFMVVPVLSSTFASFARSFGSLGVGEIGWLFVDEAGQATPQAAVGALWRSQRAVLVGDPLQLKPIVTVSDAILEHMRTHYDVESHWLPNRQSAQTLADQATIWGKMAGPAEQKSWMGLPLAVHRRCDKPMFELANRIAYDGAMVYGTIAPRSDRETLASLHTGWIHVKGPSQDNWVPAEGKALHELLIRLQADGVQAADISVITPFKIVQENLKRMLGNKMVCGTIHTMQGKEAAVVIMVMGGNTTGTGARDWAVSSPNLLNVAATRAKRRLYVIGDRDDWQNRALFCDVMDLLPEQSLPTLLLEPSV